MKAHLTASGGTKRRLVVALVVLAFLMPFLFVHVALVLLESATICSSSLECMAWRYLGGSDSSLYLREELMRALVEVEGSISDDVAMEGSSPASFNDLVTVVTSNKQDLKGFAFKTKSMMLKMEQNVQHSRQRESVFWHLASHGVPKSLNCLTLKLAEEYTINAIARSRLPSPDLISRLTNSSFHHIVLLSDNVLATSVVISSTIKISKNPENLVFHIVTDKKTYNAMHAWFAANFVSRAAVEVKGLHQFEWSHKVNIGIKEMLEIHHLIWRQNYYALKEKHFQYDEENERNLDALSPSCTSLLNHLRIYIPELFPDLNKIVFLDDDVVVQHDLSSLWELDLHGKVVGAVVGSWCGHECCPGRQYKDYFNFTNTFIASNFDSDRCGWLYGMNVFDLQAWRKTNITNIYHKWLKLNLNHGMTLWGPGAVPPALIAFDGLVHLLDPSWHLSGLGYCSHPITPKLFEAATVLHFSGPAKPWLEIGFPEVQSLWKRHVNFSNDFIKSCRIKE